MSLHSYSRCWLHLTWATLRRERMLLKPAGAKVSSFLYDYSRSKGIYMKSNYVNLDAVVRYIENQEDITRTGCSPARLGGDAATDEAEPVG